MTYNIHVLNPPHRDFYIPLKCVVGYLVGVLLLYQFGPIAWVTHRPLLFYTLQSLYIAFFAFGYYHGIRFYWKPSQRWTEQRTESLLRYLPAFVVCSIVLTFMNSFLRNYMMSRISFSSIIKRIALGLSNLGSGYSLKQEATSQTSATAYGGYGLTLLNYFWSFFDLNALFLSVVYFAKQRPAQRLLSLILLLEVLLSFLSIGTNIGVFRIVLAVAVCLWLRFQKWDLDNPWKVLKLLKSKQQKKKVFLPILLLFAVFLGYFVSVMKSRGSILNWENSSFNIGGIGLDYNSIMFTLLPDFLYIPLISVTSYLTQGLYAFSLSLEVPWIPMFGFGGSMWIEEFISKYFYNINQFTYQYRIMERFQWDDHVQWASMYTWAANDLSLYGVIALMYVIGYFFALTYRDSLTTENPFAKLLVIYFTLMCIFFPGNNQIAQFANTHLAFIGAFVAWLVTTRVRVRI